MSTLEAISVIHDIDDGVIWFVDYGSGPELIRLDGVKRAGFLLAWCPIRTV